MKKDEGIPDTIMKLIDRVLDEDLGYRTGSAEKAVNELTEKAIILGREKQLKNAMKFWKNANMVPEEVLWQWFTGVFRGADFKKKAPRKVKDESSNKHKARVRKKRRNKK